MQLMIHIFLTISSNNVIEFHLGKNIKSFKKFSIFIKLKRLEETENEYECTFMIDLQKSKDLGTLKNELRLIDKTASISFLSLLFTNASKKRYKKRKTNSFSNNYVAFAVLLSVVFFISGFFFHRSHFYYKNFRPFLLQYFKEYKPDRYVKSKINNNLQDFNLRKLQELQEVRIS